MFLQLYLNNNQKLKGDFFLSMFNSIKNFISKYKSYLIIILIIIISVISIVYQNVESKSKITINGENLSVNEKEGKIAVYITGEVNKPGVYYVEKGARLIDLLDECEGLKDSANIDELNLAELLQDSDKIDIPPKKITVEEIGNTSNDEITEEIVNSSGRVNINTATKEELKTISGIGDTLAQNIIDYRKHNIFETIEDILNVTGIGDAKFEKIKEYICVD